MNLGGGFQFDVTGEETPSGANPDSAGSFLTVGHISEGTFRDRSQK
jgi:hypothetical protein